MINKLNVFDLGTGNVTSLCSALKKININFKRVEKVSDIDSNKIILPGVGAYGDLMKRVKSKKLDIFIKNRIESNLKILGICVGYQILFSSSSENGQNKGLDILKGNFKILKSKLPKPHVGWNNCKILKKSNIFFEIPDNSDFYFTHSYILTEYEKNITIGKTKYGQDFPVAIQKKNIYGVQFHPEKSQISGLKLLRNFYENC